jgi:hypothetical protein
MMKQYTVLRMINLFEYDENVHQFCTDKYFHKQKRCSPLLCLIKKFSKMIIM